MMTRQLSLVARIDIYLLMYTFTHSHEPFSDAILTRQKYKLARGSPDFRYSR